MIRPLLLSILLLALPASADVPARLEQAFRGWVDEAGAEAAVLTVYQHGDHRTDVAIGMAADTPVELASLSKMITALCAAQMVEQGVWTLETSSFDLLGQGPKGLSVANFMTHTSGLAPDETQRPMLRWLDKQKDRAGVATAHAFGRKEQASEPGAYYYNNENYAVLGEMIAAQSGETYESYCRQLVLDPAGATSARLSPRTGSMGTWGGWQMSVQDYARLMHWAFGSDGLVGRNPKDWPQSDMGGGVSYGVGMVQRPYQGRMNYWHFGLLCFPGRLNVGSYAVLWMEEWSTVAAFDRCADWDTLIRLDNVLTEAVFQ